MPTITSLLRSYQELVEAMADGGGVQPPPLLVKTCPV